jgi:hypothetical protein
MVDASDVDETSSPYHHGRRLRTGGFGFGIRPGSSEISLYEIKRYSQSAFHRQLGSEPLMLPYLKFGLL